MSRCAPRLAGVPNESLAQRHYLGFSRPPLVIGLATRTLTTEPICAVLPEGHRLAGRAELTLADLAHERWVLTPCDSWEPWHRHYDEDFRAAGFEPDVVTALRGVLEVVTELAVGTDLTANRMTPATGAGCRCHG